MLLIPKFMASHTFSVFLLHPQVSQSNYYNHQMDPGSRCFHLFQASHEIDPMAPSALAIIIWKEVLVLSISILALCIADSPAMCPRSRNRRSPLSEIKSWREEPLKVKEAFSVVDKDGDGKISLLDLQHFFSGSSFSVGKGLSREEMEGMIAVADAHNSGSVDFEEFRRILQLDMPEIQEIKEIMPEIQEIKEIRSSSDDAQMWALKEAFNVLDRDRDGIVSTEDLKTFFSSCTASASSSCGNCTVMMSEKDLADMIEAAGGSAKCGLRYEGFARLMMTMTKTNGFS